LEKEENMPKANWVSAGSISQLRQQGHRVFKHEGKQILLLERGGTLYACNNRCPHEGYPLAEGTLSDEASGVCTLTCNWHNWKFDLSSGEAVVGGDAIRLYPTQIKNGKILVDVCDPPKGHRLPNIMSAIDEACDKYDYARIARELVRYQVDEGDPEDVVRRAIERAHNRFEYGMSHAFAAAADWMTLSKDVQGDEAKTLITRVEPIAHMAWDILRQPIYSYTDDIQPFEAEAFIAAIEETNEDEAIALLRGAIKEDLTWKELEPAFARAALAHYQDFGHAAIYVLKIGELINHLGQEVLKPAILALTRELIYASREDLIPEFRAYHDALANWSSGASTPVTWQDFRGLSVKKALERTSESGSKYENLYAALLGANAWNFLHFDTSVEAATDSTIARNVGWLDFTHSITFANAVRELCTRYPDLWPQGLLQMACFLGRNTPFTDKDINTQAFDVVDTLSFFEHAQDSLFDHAQFEHIVSCHLIKLTTATKREYDNARGAPHAALLTSALNRFLQSPIKRRHVLRTANQALKFVALENS
jgi:nitrite reductase/ring-hydroxylating ferredoxin subunit